MKLNILHRVITEEINEYLDKTVEYQDVINQKNFQIVYQVTPNDRLTSLFTHGLSREYAKSKNGNLYGAGIYSTFSLRSSQKNADNGNYGSTIIKILVPSFDRFFICNKRIAQQVYGNKFRMEDQLNILFRRHKQLLEKIKASDYYKQIVQTNDPYTSTNVLELLKVLGGAHGAADPILNQVNIRGFIFKGHHDGDVAVIRDFASAIPVAYSQDNGNTFKTDKLTHELFDKVKTRHDPIIFLGRIADNFIDPRSYRVINGYMRVQRKSDGKYNFAYKPNENNRRVKFLLPRNAWLDNASDMDQDQRAQVYIEKLGSLYLDPNGFYEEPTDVIPTYSLDLTPNIMLDDEDK